MYYDLSEEDKRKLSGKLLFWRCERPDEWTFDEFIRDAKALEAKIVELEHQLAEQSVTQILLDVVPGDGSGLEIYTKTVADVVDVLSEMGEKIEDQESEIGSLKRQLAASQAHNAFLVTELRRVEALLLSECGTGVVDQRAFEITDTAALDAVISAVHEGKQ